MPFFDPADGIVADTTEPELGTQPKKKPFFDPADGVPVETLTVAEQKDRAIDTKVAVEEKKEIEQLNNLPPALPPLAGIGSDPEENKFPTEEPSEPSVARFGDERPSLAKPEDAGQRMLTPDETKARRLRGVAEGQVSPWVANAPLELVARFVEATKPETVEARISRGAMEANQKFVTEAMNKLVTSPYGKALNLITQLVAPNTDFARKHRDTQEASRLGLFEEGKIPIVSDVMSIGALGPPSIFQTAIGPFLLPVLEAVGQGIDAAAGVENAFQPAEIAMSAIMAGLIKAGGFLPASLRQQLLLSGGKPAERILKAAIPSAVMAGEMTAIGTTLAGVDALARGDMEGFKNEWKKYPSEFANSFAVFLTLGLVPLAKAGQAGTIETKLKGLGLTPEGAKNWANNLVYNPKSVDGLKFELSQKWKGVSGAQIESLARQVRLSGKNPAHLDVLRNYHQGKEPIEIDVEKGKKTQVLRPRYVAGEKKDKATLKAKFNKLPEVERLPHNQRKVLAEAIDRHDGPIGEINAKKMAKIVHAIKLTRPLKTPEELNAMSDVKLRGYIAGTLYRSRPSARHPDMKKVGIKATHMDDKSVTHQDLVKLALYGTEKYRAEPQAEYARQAASIVEDRLVNSLMESIKDIQGVDTGVRPPGLTDPERTMVLSFLSDGKNIRKNDPTGELRKDFVDGIAYPLPRDPASLSLKLLQYQSEMRGKMMAEGQIKTPKGRRIMQKLYNSFRNFASRSMMIDKMSRDTGNYELLSVERDRVSVGKTQRSKVGRLQTDSWKLNKVNQNLRSYMADKPELENATKYIMGVDPRTKNKSLLKERNDALALVSKDARGTEILKMAEAYRGLLNGESAVNVRLIKVNEYGEIRDENKQAYREIEATPEKARTAKQKKLFASIKQQLAEYLPWRFNEKTGKAEQVSIEEMDQAWQIRKTSSEQGVHDYLAKLGWGNRDYYFMSTKNINVETILKPRGVEIAPSFKEPIAKDVISPTKRVEQRLGVPEFKEGSPWSAMDRHMANLAVQAHTMNQARFVVNTVNDAANRGLISKATAAKLNQAVKSDLGQVIETSQGPKVLYGVTRTWWTAFGLILPKMAWYTARNVLYQGMPWGALAGQYKMVDILAAHHKLPGELSNPNSKVRTHTRVRRKDNVLMDKAIFYEGFLQFAHSERTKLPNKVVGALQETSAATFGFSDNYNRSYNMVTGDVILNDYVGRFVKGNINQAQLERGLKLHLMPEGHRRYLTDLFSKAVHAEHDKAGNPVLREKNFKNFVWETSEVKTLLANYPYQVTERSALEQNPDFRWFYGIPVYMRGTVEVVNETGIRPLGRVWQDYKGGGYKKEHLDLRTARDAIGNITAHLLGRAISSLIIAETIGERRDYANRNQQGPKVATADTYDIAETVASYSFLGPGGSVVLKLTEAAGGLAKAIKSGNSESATRNAQKIANEIYYFSAVLPTAKTFMEAIGDRQGMRNVDVIQSLIKGRIEGGIWNERDGWAAFMHVIFDTEPPDRDSLTHKLWRELKKGLKD